MLGWVVAFLLDGLVGCPSTDVVFQFGVVDDVAEVVGGLWALGEI